MVNISVLVSGGGTNLGELIKAEKDGRIKNGRITAVISSNPEAYALTRAKEASIPREILEPAAFKTREEYAETLITRLKAFNTDLVVLAGFMYVLPPFFVREFHNRIINVHPSLIPAFCGGGYYGIRVHRAVLDYGVKLTGATVHFVSEETDAGPVILQKSVAVLENDTPEILQRRVMEQAEWEILPEAVSLFSEGRLKITGRIVAIKDV